jgi:hypothetical protein
MKRSSLQFPTRSRLNIAMRFLGPYASTQLALLSKIGVADIFFRLKGRDMGYNRHETARANTYLSVKGCCHHLIVSPCHVADVIMGIFAMLLQAMFTEIKQKT